jgi:hypothetical protein
VNGGFGAENAKGASGVPAEIHVARSHQSVSKPVITSSDFEFALTGRVQLNADGARPRLKVSRPPKSALKMAADLRYPGFFQLKVVFRRLDRFGVGHSREFPKHRHVQKRTDIQMI